ncbi:MAG: aroQ 2 [Xanthobacteraceae bacterium]|jgi:3-dehydroquinate dehydratase-2|nr:aroQ 2 [Xanthobacteraceae bacterium]
MSDIPASRRIEIINGSNTNLYGQDPAGPYGHLTLANIEQRCRERAERFGFALGFRQSNHEGVLIDWIQEARGAAEGIVINAGSLSYTSIGLRDALAAFAGPIFQVHVSNVYQREPFRHHSPLSAVATGCIAGLGPYGYELAVEAIALRLGEG